MSINKYIKEKENIDITYQMFKDKNDINIKEELASNNKIKQNIFKSRPFKISLALTILVLVMSLSMTNIKYIRERRIFEEDILNIVELCTTTGKGDEIGSSNRFYRLFRKNNYYKSTLYSIEVNIDDSYVMCGYRIQEYPGLVLNFHRSQVDWNEVMWVKYDKEDVIKEEIDGKYVFVIYNVYDILLKEDLINNITYNIKYKYYQWSIFDMRRTKVIPQKEMVLVNLENIVETSSRIIDDYTFGAAYELYESKESELYVVFIKYRVCVSEGEVSQIYELKSDFQTMHDELVNYCIDNEDLTEEIYREKLNGEAYKEIQNKTMISIEDIKKILIEGELE